MIFVCLCSGCNFLYIASNRYLLPEICPTCRIKVTHMDPEYFSQEFIKEIMELKKDGQAFALYFPSSDVFFANKTSWSAQAKEIIKETKYPQELVFRIQDLK